MDAETATLFATLDICLKLAGGAFAIWAFLLGLRQYALAQKWQKAGVVLSLMDSFEEDKRIEAACGMLDWDEREFVLEGAAVPFRNEMLLSALRVPVMDIAAQEEGARTEGIDSFTKQESAIRDAFDAFFDFFCKLHAFQKAKLLLFEDYVYFYYWLELLSDVGRYKNDARIQHMIDRYIDAYHFDEVRELVEQYRRTCREALRIDERHQAKGAETGS